MNLLYILMQLMVLIFNRFTPKYKMVYLDHGRYNIVMNVSDVYIEMKQSKEI